MLKQQHYSQHQSFVFLCSKFQVRAGSIDLYQGQNRTLVAARAIKEDRLILSIPDRYFINWKATVVKQTPITHYIEILKTQFFKRDSPYFRAQGDRRSAQTLLQRIQDNKQRLYSVIYLIQQRFIKNQSKNRQKTSQQVELVHSHYANLLPQDYNYHPINFINQIQAYHQDIAQILSRKQENLDMIFEILVTLVFRSYGGISFFDYLEKTDRQSLISDYVLNFTQGNCKWAINVLETREFEEGLVPLIDLINHSPNPNTFWTYDIDQKTFLLQSTRYINQGQELIFTYGKGFTTQHLFCTYGFFSREIGEIELPIGAEPQYVLLKFYTNKEASITKIVKAIRQFCNEKNIEMSKQVVDQFFVTCRLFKNEKKEALKKLGARLQRYRAKDGAVRNALQALQEILHIEIDFLVILRKRKEELTKRLLD